MTDSPISKSGGMCTIDIRSEEGMVVVKCKGRLVFGQTGPLKDGVRGLLPKSRRVVIDLSEVNFMDSSGLGTIVGLYVSAKKSHCELQLINLAPRVRELFGLAHVLSVFEPIGEYNIRMP